MVSGYLRKDSRAQKVPHLLQDLFLKYVPRHRALQIQNEWIAEPARVTEQNRRQCGRCLWGDDGMVIDGYRGGYLRPCCPAQARLHTSSTIFSACSLFLLGL